MNNSSVFNYIKKTDRSNEAIDSVNLLGLSKSITKKVYSISFEEFKTYIRLDKPEQESASLLFFLLNTNNIPIVDYFLEGNIKLEFIRMIVKTGRLELVSLLTGKYKSELDEALKDSDFCLEIVEFTLNKVDLFIEIFKNFEWQLIDALKLKIGNGFKEIAKLDIESFAKVNSTFNFKSYFEIYKVRLSANYKNLIKS